MRTWYVVYTEKTQRLASSWLAPVLGQYVVHTDDRQTLASRPLGASPRQYVVHTDDGQTLASRPPNAGGRQYVPHTGFAIGQANRRRLKIRGESGTFSMPGKAVAHYPERRSYHPGNAILPTFCGLLHARRWDP